MQKSNVQRADDLDVAMDQSDVYALRDHLPPTTPERALLRAVLEDALNVLQRGCRCVRYAPGRGCHCAYADTVTWVKARHIQPPFGFDALCEILGIDADGLRRGLAPYLRSRQNGHRGRR